MESLATQLLHSDLEVPCPECDFELWIRVAEILAECTVLCPVCRTRIRLRDDRGGTHNAGSMIESTLDSMIKEVFG